MFQSELFWSIFWICCIGGAIIALFALIVIMLGRLIEDLINLLTRPWRRKRRAKIRHARKR